MSAFRLAWGPGRIVLIATSGLGALAKLLLPKSQLPELISGVPWSVWTTILLAGVLLALIEGAFRRVSQAEKKLEPRLELLSASGSPPYEVAEGITRLFRVGVENVGGVQLNHCSVRLNHIAPLELDRLIPFPLRLHNDRGQKGFVPDYKQEFSLAPGDITYLDVADLDEPVSGAKIRLCLATGLRQVSMKTSLRIHIRAAAELGLPAEPRFLLKRNDDGRLSMEAQEDPYDFPAFSTGPSANSTDSRPPQRSSFRGDFEISGASRIFPRAFLRGRLRSTA